MPRVKRGRLYIGTSGWIYGDWIGIFYPEDLRSKDRLKYFSSHFNTTEINYSFYHLPKPTTYENWYNQTNKNFVFAVKTSRYITHIKRLIGVKDAWKVFLKNTLHLKDKLGPVLFQFPPSFKASDENIKRLKELLKLINKAKIRFAFEFRHKSWCGEAVYDILKRFNIAWVIADSPNYPKAEAITANFAYIRMHGSRALFSSKYTHEELQTLAQKIKVWLKKGVDTYVYFNNDFHGYAVQDAKVLLNLLANYK
jgi:uncharacterized protein YecE (DUF72 family)